MEKICKYVNIGEFLSKIMKKNPNTITAPVCNVNTSNSISFSLWLMFLANHFGMHSFSLFSFVSYSFCPLYFPFLSLSSVRRTYSDSMSNIPIIIIIIAALCINTLLLRCNLLGCLCCRLVVKRTSLRTVLLRYCYFFNFILFYFI